MGKNKDFYPDPTKNPYRVRNSPATSPAPSSMPASPRKIFVDFNTQRVCPSCGKVIKLSYNFCKYCGVDLSEIEPIGNSDEISKQLAITAVTDVDASVRQEAIDTLGSFGEKKILGVLTYVLLNDPDENVRREAADELGDLHHPYSLEALAKALKDQSPLVRKEAIEGLKKIKKKQSSKKLDKGKPKDRQSKEEDKKKEDNEDIFGMDDKKEDIFEMDD